jgi:hypothetical protein
MQCFQSDQSNLYYLSSDFDIVPYFNKQSVHIHVLAIIYLCFHPMTTACDRNMYSEEILNNSNFLLHVCDKVDIMHIHILLKTQVEWNPAETF